MNLKVHTLELSLDWELLSLISRIDRFDATWSSIEKKEGQSLKELKSIETVRSVGASTRIEGSKMSDEEVDTLLKNLDLTKLEDRDSQEVIGYFEVFDTISEFYEDIGITENEIKNLHNILLKYSTKDEWHKGNYKLNSNAVEATLSDGTKKIIFEPTAPGFPTEDAMRALIDWYQKDDKTLPLVKFALFVYEFLSIHPFQDGNGRMSRLLTTLLLMKKEYKWIQFVSLEHEIENKKTEYYFELRKCQAQRPGEDVTSWVIFFFRCLINIQDRLLNKLNRHGIDSHLSPREKRILIYIGDHPGSKSGEIASALKIPNPTVKRFLIDLTTRELLEKHGIGRGTNYTVR